MKKLTDHLTFRHGVTVQNRLVQAPMLTNSGIDGLVSNDTLAYYEARSQSAGMVITEYTYVSPNGGPAATRAHDRTQLAIYDDRFVPRMAQVAQALKRSGNRTVLQIAHTGRLANFAGAVGRRAEAPSVFDFATPLDYPVHELTDAEIRQIVRDFGAATHRAIQAGFDGVEIHGANHYLLQQFFSRYYNRRTDHWGGSLGRRMNFPLAVAQAVFEVVAREAPRDFIVGYRLSPEEVHQTDGYTWHEAVQLVQALTTRFPFDYVHLSLPDAQARPADAPQTFAQLFRPAIGEQAKEIIVGHVRSEADMQAVLPLTDLIAVARATLIDPRIGAKLDAGQGSNILTAATPENFAAAHLTPGLRQNLAYYFNR